MARGRNGEVLQAIEIQKDTVVGVLTAVPCIGRVIHSPTGGDLVFHFPSGDVTITADVGSDFVAGSGCTGVTSVESVILA